MNHRSNPARPLAMACACALALHAQPSQAQSPPPPAEQSAAVAAPLSLARALALFRQGNLELAAARHDLDAQRADVIAAGVLPNPNVVFGVALLAHGQPQGGRESYQVVVDQVLPVAGQVGLRKGVASEFATAAERDFAAAAWALSNDLREAYLDLQVAQARFRVLQAGMSDLGRVETILSQRAAAGANPEYDRLRVTVERNNLAGRLAEAVGDLAAARTALAQAIGPGVDPAGLSVEDEIPEAPDPPANLDSLMSTTLLQRPEAAAARSRASAASLRIRQIRREYVPSPDLQLGYNFWTGINTNAGERSGGAVLVGLGIPLPLFDRGQGRVDRAVAEEQSARLRSQAVELGLRRETQREAHTMTARVEAWRRYRDTTAGQVDRLRSIAESAYREGKSGILELLDAYRAHRESSDRALELKSQAWRATLRTERAVGPRS